MSSSYCAAKRVYTAKIGREGLTRDVNGCDEGASPFQAMPLSAVRRHAVVHAQLQDLRSGVQHGSGVAQVGDGEQPAALHRSDQCS